MSPNKKPSGLRSKTSAADGASYATPDSAVEVARAFYSASDLAVRWGLSLRQVRRIIADHLTPTRFKTAVRISAEELARYEAACAESVAVARSHANICK